MNDRKKLGRLKLALLILSNLVVCLNSTSIAVHYVNSINSGQAYNLCDTSPGSYYQAKKNNQSTTTSISFWMLIVGDGAAFTLAIILLVWVFKKIKDPEDAVTALRRVKIVSYLLISVSLLCTSNSLGYYLTYYVDSYKCSANSTIPQLFLAVWIMTGISTLFLIAMLVICMVLPKKVDMKYLVVNEKSAVNVEMEERKKEEVVIKEKKPEVLETGDEMNKNNVFEPPRKKQENKKSEPSLVELPPSLPANFEQRKQRIIQQFKDQRQKHSYKVPPTQSPFSKLQQSQPEVQQHSQVHDFVSKHRSSVGGSPGASNFLASPHKNLPSENDPLRTPIKSSERSSILDYNLNSPVHKIEQLESPGKNSHPSGMIRSRKRIFDRTGDYNKQANFRKQLQNKYGML